MNSIRPLALSVLPAALVLTAMSPAQAAAPAAPPDSVVQLEDTLTQVAERAVPSVVVITNKRVERRPVYSPHNLPPEFRFFFGIPEQQQDDDADGDVPPQQQPSFRGTPAPAGKGSGVIIRNDGTILTNYHVIEDADALEVKLHDGRVFDNSRNKNEVVVLGVDKETDLAVLKIGNGALKDLPALPFADSAKVKVGQFAIAVGAPFNLDYSVSVGNVSQKGRYDVNINTYENYIQTDASINPGNSGGPLLNIRGEIIGINEFIVTGGPASRGSVGVGFAIASNLARQVAESLASKGAVVRPWLGISMQPLTAELKRQFKVDGGILLNDVFKGEPAAKAGLRPGDVVTRVGKNAVNSPHDLQFAVLAYSPGELIPVSVVRNGKELEFKVTASQRGGRDAVAAGTAAPAAAGGDLLGKLGLALEESKDGVKVKSVALGSPAAAAQVRRNDVILEVNRQPVKNAADVLTALGGTDAGAAVLYIDRKGNRFFVPLAVDGAADKPNP